MSHIDFINTLFKLNPYKEGYYSPHYLTNDGKLGRQGYGSDTIREFPFGKKMYVVLDEKLVAIIPIEVMKLRKISSFLGCNPCYDGWGDCLICKMAGKEELQLIDNLAYKHFFLTKEAYDSFVLGDKMAEYKPKKFNLVSYFKENGHDVYSEGEGKPWELRGYYIDTNRTSASRTRREIKLLCLNEMGLEYQLQEYLGDGEKKDKAHKIYKSTTECMLDNKITDVVDFDEDVEEEKPIQVTAKISLTINAETTTDAVSKAKQILDYYGIKSNEICTNDL